MLATCCESILWGICVFEYDTVIHRRAFAMDSRDKVIIKSIGYCYFLTASNVLLGSELFKLFTLGALIIDNINFKATIAKLSSCAVTNKLFLSCNFKNF